MRLAGLFLLLLAGFAEPDETEERIRRWRTLYTDRARAIVAARADADSAALTLVDRPILTFSNPVRPDALHGAGFLWTDRGIPRAIGAVWSAEDQKERSQRNLCYEFYSLSEHPLDVTIANSDVRWKPKESGLEWLTLSDAPAPAGSRPLRLTQMRRLAGEWSAEGQTGEAELRLLPQPVYRYPETVTGPLDGAIFAFVMGTDPELFVLLEAWPMGEGSTSSWRVSPVRFSGTPLTLKRNDAVLWSREVWAHYDRELTYDFLYGIERLTDANLPESDSRSP